MFLPVVLAAKSAWIYYLLDLLQFHSMFENARIFYHINGKLVALHDYTL